MLSWSLRAAGLWRRLWRLAAEDGRYAVAMVAMRVDLRTPPTACQGKRCACGVGQASGREVVNEGGMTGRRAHDEASDVSSADTPDMGGQSSPQLSTASHHSDRWRVGASSGAAPASHRVSTSVPCEAARKAQCFVQLCLWRLQPSTCGLWSLCECGVSCLSRVCASCSSL